MNKPRHAELSASGAHRWAVCPGSYKAEKGLPNNYNEAAYEGTCAHELAEVVLNSQGGSALDLVGEQLVIKDHDADSPFPEDFLVTDDMAYHVQQYVDRCRAVPGEHFVEVKGSYERWVPGGFGTADFVSLYQDASVAPESYILVVRDLKFGRGIAVHAESNLQGVCYALSAFDKYEMLYDITEISIEIDQPRLDAVTSWVISKDELLELGDQLTVAAVNAMSDSANRYPGEKQCQFCKAKATCAELKDYVENKVMMGLIPLDEEPDDLFEDGYTKDIKDDITLDEAVLIEKNRTMALSFFEANRDRLFNAMMGGEDIPAFRIVEGKTSRAYDVSQEEMEDIFKRAKIPKTKTHVEKLKTGPALEKEFKSDTKIQKVLKNHLIKPKGKPTLALANDPRASWAADTSGVEALD